jgi:hypothetical protein
MERLNGGNGLGRQPVGSQPGVSQVRATVPPLVPAAAPIGEIIDTSVADFAAQACKLNVAPPFGAFVKVTLPEQDAGRTIYAVVYAIHTGSLEPGGRPVLRGRDGMRDGAIFTANPDLEQLLRTEFSALIIGFDEGGPVRTFLPPSPPPLHWSVVTCNDAETARLTARLDYFRTIISARDAPVDALLVANIRLASRASPDVAAFRLRAGRELATLLKHDYPRLTAILRALID